MSLDNYPVPCECGKHTVRQGVPNTITHLATEPCPFKDDKLPIGMHGCCCWLRGVVAARELAALGENDLSGRMRKDMTAEEALAFSDELVTAADRLERQYADRSDKPKGAFWNGRMNEKHEWVWETFSTFEMAVASIREAARWYRKVALLGYGVVAWY